MKKVVFVIAFLVNVCLVCVYGEDAALPLTRVTLYTSGVGFFVHNGLVRGDVAVGIPFQADAVNDALKSLVVDDAASNMPQVSYPAENTLLHTLRSLKIDLSGRPGITEILESLKGEEIEVAVPGSLKGRIMGIERRTAENPLNGAYTQESFLSLSTAAGIRVIRLNDIASFSFSDAAINQDLTHALDLIQNTRGDDIRVLRVRLPGDGVSGGAERPVTLSYVVPTPVWKASYRLDLAARDPFIQGWAIIDNDSDQDWENVSVSLVTGRPVSFIQNLYAPYYLYRPTLPLAIAGSAEAATFESGYSGYADSLNQVTMKSAAAVRAPVPAPRSYSMAEDAAGEYNLSSGRVITPEGRALGEQFEFTLKTPITLPRRQSTMVALVEGGVGAVKTLVLNGAKAAVGAVHPAVAVEVTNNTGMKLPAGPVTVYEGGAYAGDALMDFFSDGASQFIGYGDDLSVTGIASSSGKREIAAVKMARGVMSITRRQVYERTYTINNLSAEAKNLVLEHPVTAGTTLDSPAEVKERTANLYRFTLGLNPRSAAAITVRETRNMEETVLLAELSFDTLFRYTTDQEVKDEVKAALRGAVERKLAVNEEETKLVELQSRRAIQVSEQDRIRRNLEAAGVGSPQGQNYLARLTKLDDEIDSLRVEIAESSMKLQELRNSYGAYIADLEI